MKENVGILKVLLLLTKAVKPREKMVNHDQMLLQFGHSYVVHSVHSLWYA